MSDQDNNEVTEHGIHWKTWGFAPHKLSIREDFAYQNERIFVGIRGVLENNEGRCMDNENDRLIVCNSVFNWIKQNLL